MGFENKYPYTDFHELNLDWVLEVVKRLETEWPEYKTTIETEWNNYKDSLTGEGGEWPTFKTAVETIISNFIHDVVGQYNGNINYQPGMFCYYDGNVYKCMTGSSAAFPRPFNSYNWFSYANQDTNSIVNDLYNYLSTELSSQNTKIYNWIMNTAAQWDSETSYVAGDYCSAIVGGFGVPPTWRYFKCLQDCTNIDVLDTDYWEEVVFASDVAERIAAYKQAMQDQYDQFLEDYQRTFGVVQTRGSSTTDVMSQKAVSDELQAHDDMLDNLIKDIAPVYDSTKAYKIGILLTYLGKQYYCIADAPAGTLPTDTTYFEEKSVADIIEMIKNGEITVGKASLADNFDSKMVLTDNSGYLYRTTGGSLEVGEQNRVKKIIGASVPIIQLTPDNAKTVSGTDNTSSGSFLTSPFTTVDSVIGHVYLITFSVEVSDATKFNKIRVRYPFSSNFMNLTTGSKTKFVIIGSATYTNLVRLQFNKSVSEATGTTYNITDFSAIDLTQTFSPTVANRLYALEQAQVGAGIAKAKEILVKDYYPYNVTAFTHTKTSGKVNTGFNQWDEQYELGTYDAQTGLPLVYNDRIRTKNPIEVVSNTTYYFKTKTGLSAGNVYCYDANMNFIESFINKGNNTFTTPSNCKFINVSFGSPYGATYNHDICINLHWDGERDGEYEPYQEWNYPVEDIELKGILSLDAQDNWVADGDEYLPSGVVDENFDIIDLSSLNWTYVTDYTYPLFKTSIANLNFAVPVGTMNVACAKYVSIGSQYYETFRSNNYDKCCCVINNQNVSTNFAIQDSAYTDATAFKNSLSGVYLVYKKVTPTQSSADSYTELQNDSNWGTEKWIDTRDVPMPVFSTCEYIPDLKAKLETAPESPDEDGDYIMHRENGLNSYGSLSTWLSANGYNKLVSITGYDATKTQTLKNVQGVFTWVDDQ